MRENYDEEQGGTVPELEDEEYAEAEELQFPFR